MSNAERSDPRYAPSSGLRALEHAGRTALLGWAMLRAVRRPRTWLAATIVELRRQAFESLGLALVLTALGGALIAQQTGVQFQNNLPKWVIGAIVAASLITEVAPLFVGFALVGTVGTRITAELASMQVSDQIDALEVIGRDPVAHLVLPRVGAGLLVGPLLVSLCLAGSMFAGWWMALLTTDATSADFWFGVRHYMRDFPMFYALIKGACFSLAITFIACYAGLQARGGSAGVGHTARLAVVAMISSVIALDTALVPLLKVVRV